MIALTTPRLSGFGFTAFFLLDSFRTTEMERQYPRGYCATLVRPLLNPRVRIDLDGEAVVIGYLKHRCSLLSLPAHQSLTLPNVTCPTMPASSPPTMEVT